MYPPKGILLSLILPSALSRFVPTAFTKSDIPSLSGDNIPCNKPNIHDIQIDENIYPIESEKKGIEIKPNLAPPFSASLWDQVTETTPKSGPKSDGQKYENKEAQETINFSDVANADTVQSEGDDSKTSGQNEVSSDIHTRSNEDLSGTHSGLTKRAGFGIGGLARSFGRRLGSARRVGGSTRGFRKSASFGNRSGRLGQTKTSKIGGSGLKKKITKTKASVGKKRKFFGRKKSKKTPDDVIPGKSSGKSTDSTLDTNTPAAGNKAATGSAIPAGIPGSESLSNVSGGRGTGSTPASGAVDDNVPGTKKKSGTEDTDDELAQNDLRQNNQRGGNNGGGSGLASNLASTVPFLAVPLAGSLIGAGGDGGGNGNGGDGSGARGTASADDEEEAPESDEAQSETGTSAKSSQKSSAKADS